MIMESAYHYQAGGQAQPPSPPPPAAGPRYCVSAHAEIRQEEMNPAPAWSACNPCGAKHEQSMHDTDLHLLGHLGELQSGLLRSQGQDGTLLLLSSLHLLRRSLELLLVPTCHEEQSLATPVLNILIPAP